MAMMAIVPEATSHPLLQLDNGDAGISGWMGGSLRLATRVPRTLKAICLETPTKKHDGGHTRNMNHYRCRRWCCRTNCTTVARICFGFGNCDGSIADAVAFKDSSRKFAPFSTLLVTRPDGCVRHTREKLFSRGRTVNGRIRMGKSWSGWKIHSHQGVQEISE
ncbi:hypothetical protein PspLS_09198 [Pyricularia sp. CBS 133598]|nr:hypothetical protein PspLS_09198 [Pyricularia sp. CBS 133598]